MVNIEIIDGKRSNNRFTLQNEYIKYLGIYRKKPIELKVFQTDKKVLVATEEGLMEANAGSYLVIGVKGEVYSIKHDIFLETYERVIHKDD
jgi:hypothetical protein